MTHWMYDDKSLSFYHSVVFTKSVMADLPKTKGDHSLVNLKGNNYFLSVVPNSNITREISKVWFKH